METIMTSRIINRRGSVILYTVLAAALSCFAGTASADSETRATGPFHAVSFSGSWSVDVTVGKEMSVVLEGDKDTIAKVKAEVIDGELHVGIDRGLTAFLFGRHDVGDLTAHITVPALTAFTLQGSGNADIKGLNGGRTALVVSGSGDIKATGKVDTVDLVVNGSGRADLSGLVSAKASATINGSGDATVNPSESLAAVINGSGQVSYVSEGAKITSVIHGSGMVERQ